MRTLLARVTNSATLAAVSAERSLLSTLRAGCHAPLGVQTNVDEGQIRLEAVVLSPDGHQRWMASAYGEVSDPVSLGRVVAGLLTAQGVERVLRPVTATP